MYVQRVSALLLVGVCIVLRSCVKSTAADVLGSTFDTSTDLAVEDDNAPLQNLESRPESRSMSSTHDKELDTAEQDFGSLFSDFPGLQDFPGIGELLRTITTTPAPPPQYPHPLSGYVSQRQQSLLNRPDITSRMPTSIVDEPTKAVRNSPEAPSYLYPKLRPPKEAEEETPKAESFPKIFRFNNDRINIADFDHRKKVQKTYNSLAKGDSLDPERIQRNKFLILHGGVYNHEEPLAFARIYEAQSSPPKAVAHIYEFVPPQEEKPRGYSFFYRTK